jgi:hypothetical protein
MASLLKSRRIWLVAVTVVTVASILWPLTAPLRGVLVCLDPERDYHIELGRGSGWHGLDTVKVRSDGTVTLHRMSHPFDRWETATLRLPPTALALVVDAVGQNRLLALKREYHEESIADGTQWVFWVKQGWREKAVYLSNAFPDQILRFAKALDGILAANGLGTVAWRAVAASNGRHHERELWDSIER